MENKGLIKELSEQLEATGIDPELLQNKSPTVIKSKILKYISGGRSETYEDGVHKETFLKTPFVSIY